MLRKGLIRIEKEVEIRNSQLSKDTHVVPALDLKKATDIARETEAVKEHQDRGDVVGTRQRIRQKK